MKRGLILITLVFSLLAGIVGCRTDQQVNISSLLSDDTSHTWVAWCDMRSVGDHDVHLRKIGSAGEVISDKTLFTGNNRRVNISEMASDGNGGVFVIWEVLVPRENKEGPHDFDRHTCVNVDGQGNIGMSRDFFIRGTRIASDGQGDFYAYGSTREYTLIEKVDRQGSNLWEYNLAGYYSVIRCAPGTNRETLVLLKNLDNPYFVVQKLDADGQVCWGETGIPEGVRIKYVTSDASLPPGIIGDGSGGAVVVWSEQLSGYLNNIWRCLISADGNVACGNPLYEIGSAANIHVRAVEVLADGVIVIWEDHGSDGMGLYAQKIDVQGRLVWPENGAAVCAGLPRVSPRMDTIITDEGGVAVFWIDGDGNLSAQMLDSSGRKQWADSGIRIAKGVDDLPLVVIGDNQHGFTVAWSAGGKAYTQKINSAGDFLWDDDGVMFP